ncbi:MAG: glycosyltransferase [candidate division KSB1 bacterium]|nr:glycosyltransferase [candidate division KSB1 bacterium]
MRFVLIGPAYPLRGGISRFNARLFRSLRSRGHTVLALNFRRQYPQILFPGRSQEDPSPPDEMLSAPRILDSVGPRSWFRTAQVAARFRPDAVVFHHWMPFFALAYGSVGALVRRTCKAPIVWICHNLTPHERQPFGRLLNKLGLRSAHGCVVMSEAVRQELQALRRNIPHRLVAHPAEEFSALVDRFTARRILGLPQGIPILLFFGYVRAYKGLDILLQAVPLVLARRQVYVLVAGEFYEPREKYARLARELGVEQAVEMRDTFVPEGDVPLYLAACDAVVLPYRTATQSGIVPLAYAHRRPVVTTAVGGLPEVVKDGKTGVLASLPEPENVAAAILRFLELHDQVDWEGEIAAVRSSMSWERFVDALEDLVRELDGRNVCGTSEA